MFFKKPEIVGACVGLGVTALIGLMLNHIAKSPDVHFPDTPGIERMVTYNPQVVLENMPHFSVKELPERTKRLLSNIEAFPFKPEVLYSTYNGIRLGLLHILREGGKPENLNIEFYVENAQMEFLVEQLTMGDNMSAEVFLARSVAIILNPGFEYLSPEERAQLFAPMREGLLWVMRNGNSVQAELALDIAEGYFDELFLEREDNAEILEYSINMISNRDVTVRLNHALQAFRHLPSFKKAGMDIRMMRVFCQANLSKQLPLSERLRAAAFLLNNYDTMIVNPGNIYDLTPDALAQIKALVVNIINDALCYPDKKINESAVILANKFRHVFTESQLRAIDRLIKGKDLDILFSVNGSDLLTDKLFIFHGSDAENFLLDTEVYPFDLKVLSAAKEAVAMPLSMLRQMKQAGKEAPMRILLAQLNVISAEDFLAHATAVVLNADFRFLSSAEKKQVFSVIQKGLLWVLKNGDNEQKEFSLDIGLEYFSDLTANKEDKKVFLEALITMIRSGYITQRLERYLQVFRHMLSFKEVDLDVQLLETFYKVNFEGSPEEPSAIISILKTSQNVPWFFKANWLTAIFFVL